MAKNDAEEKNKSQPVPRFVKICLIIGVASLVVLPALAIGVAAWKYKQERAAQELVGERPPVEGHTNRPK